MSWRGWVEELRQVPERAVADLLRGAADVAPFERVAAHEFLLAVLPRSSRTVAQTLLGEPPGEWAEDGADLPGLLDAGLQAWLLRQRQAAPPPPRKLGAYAAQVCEALQWPVYFKLPGTLETLRAGRVLWLSWLAPLAVSAYRDPEYDYWQALAARQSDDSLQFFWQSFVVEAGRLRSLRYLNLGLLALARLPLSEEDSQRNLRLQVQSLVNRYQRRKSWGLPAQEELAESLRGVMARNLSLGAANYRAFLYDLLLGPLGEDKTLSVLSLLGLAKLPARPGSAGAVNSGRLKPPGSLEIHNQAAYDVQHSKSLAQAWKVMAPLLSAHEDYLHKSGDAYYFVRTLDRCARALCQKYPLRDPEVQGRLFQWIHLALRLDADDPRLWMLWELALRQAGQPGRAQWVLWEMTRRFPDQLPCRVELARLLAESGQPDDEAQAQRLLRQVLQLDANNVHARSTLAQLAIRRQDWAQALEQAREGLRIKPDDQASAVLQAATHAWRNGSGDLAAAISDLQRFVDRYPGNPNAEVYLGKLRRRQVLAEQGRFVPLEEEAEAARPAAPPPAETDAAWQAFADSLAAWQTAPAGPDGGRVLPLPRALRRALANDDWEAGLLDGYEAAAQREFPLEIRLWRYLQTCHNAADPAQHNQARQAVQDWLAAEERAADAAQRPWTDYLQHRWQAVSADPGAGAEWLADLLDRYQPLPAPLFA